MLLNQVDVPATRKALVRATYVRLELHRPQVVIWGAEPHAAMPVATSGKVVLRPIIRTRANVHYGIYVPVKVLALAKVIVVYVSIIIGRALVKILLNERAKRVQRRNLPVWRRYPVRACATDDPPDSFWVNVIY